MYGFSDATVLSRDKEIMNLQIAAAAGCFPRILATFKNGLIYPYQSGRIMTFTDLRKPEVITEVCRLLYNIHHIDVDSLRLVDRKGMPATYKKSNLTLAVSVGFINKIPKTLNDAEKDLAFQEVRKVITDEFLTAELEFVSGVLSDLDIPMTLNHMDLHPKNMIIDDKTGKIGFVDYEGTGFTYEYHDMNRLFINNMMYKAQGTVSLDEEPFPSDEVRKQFLDAYLRAKYENTDDEKDHTITERELECFDVQHRIIEIVIYLQFLVIYMSFLNAPVGMNVWNMMNLFKDQYFLKKDQLPGLKERYRVLSNVSK